MKGGNMRTIKVKVFTFDELNDDAKERAREWYRRGQEPGGNWASEWRQTAEEAAKFLPFEITDWSVGDYRQFVKIRVKNNDVADMSGVRLWKWLKAGSVNGSQWFNLGVDPFASCPFTGYCGDDFILDPIRVFLVRPDISTTGRELFQACADSWVDAWAKDMEWCDSNECIDENILANGYEFDENGRRA